MSRIKDLHPITISSNAFDIDYDSMFVGYFPYEIIPQIRSLKKVYFEDQSIVDIFLFYELIDSCVEVVYTNIHTSFHIIGLKSEIVVYLTKHNLLFELDITNSTRYYMINGINICVYLEMSEEIYSYSDIVLV